MDQTIFLTKVRTAEGKKAARRLIGSLRAFGGEMSRCSFWLFEADPQRTPCKELEDETVRIIPMEVPGDLLRYELGDKVYACARAEELAPAEVQSLVWIDPLCLVVNPPRLYQLGETLDAAVRPVHLRNLGLLLTDPLDAYWEKIYETVGVKDIAATVETFIEGQTIRAYFNTHAFAVNPAKGTLRRWLECFTELVCDQDFQAGACRDENHQVYLHQAVLSTLIAACLAPERVRSLPPEYNYPYLLQGSIPEERRAKVLNDLVLIACEDFALNPSEMDDIEIREPLRSWLAGHDEQS